MSSQEKSSDDIIKELNKLRLENEALKTSITNLTKINNPDIEASAKNIDYKNFFNLAIDLLCIADTEGNFVKVNQAWEDILGFSTQELEKRKFLEFVHPDDMQPTLDAIATLQEQKNVVAFTNRYKNSKGEWRYIEWYSYPLGNLIYAAARDITQKKELENQLIKKNEELLLSKTTIEESERNYRKIFNSTSDAIFIHDTKTGKIVDVNETMLRMYGFSSKDEVISIDMECLSAADDGYTAEKANEMISLALSRNTNVFEWYAKNKQGEKFWVEVSLRNTAIEGKKRIIGIVRDISERKKLEKSIQQAHETYKGIIDSVGDAIYIQDKDGKFLDVNKTAESFYGYSRDYFIGRTPEFLSAPNKNDLASVAKTVQEAYNGKSKIFEFWGVTKDGKIFPKEVSVSPGYYFGQKVVVAVGRDISERIKAQEAIQASEERFSLVADATELGIWDWNIETNEVYYSPQWKKQVGYEDHELKNEFKTWQSLLHPDDYERMHNEINTYLSNPKGYFRAEFRLKHKSGSYVWIFNKASAKKDENGKVIRFFGSHTDITERKKAEKLIKEKSEELEAQNEEYKQLNEELLIAKESIEDSEKKFRSLVENSFDGIYLLENRNFVYVNPRFLDITGYSVEELTNKKFDINSLLTDKSKKIVEKLYRERVQGHNQPIRYEIQICTKNFELKQVELSTINIGTEENILIMGIMRDVTLRKKMEREIAHRSRLQNLLVNLGANFINIPHHNIDDEINKALHEMGTFSGVDRVYIFSYDFEAGFMSNTYEWCSPDTEPEIQNLQNLPNSLVPQWLDAHTNGKTIYIPKVDKLPEDDSVRQILEAQNVKSLITIPMIYDEKCLGFVGFDAVKDYKIWSDSEVSMLRLFAELLVNVQVKTEYEQSLRDAKNLAEHKQMEVRSIIDNSPIGIALISTSGEVLNINRAAVTMLGSPSAHEIKKVNFFNVEKFKDIGLADDFLRCIETKTIISNEGKHLSKWGRAIYGKYYLVPIVIDGEVKSVLVNVEDISSIKETEQKLIYLKEKAEESDRLKSAFLANMSHEIRTPMNAICGLSNLLLDENVSQEQKENFVEIININSQQLLGIINDIIDISKIESGQINVSSIKFSVNDMIKEVELAFSQTARLKNLELECKPGLPIAESIILSDEMKIKQILNNIVFNAIKFTDKGKVELGYSLNNGNIEFYVSDTGVGISKEKFDLIFERFRQIEDESNRSRSGTGLGLPISKAFVEMLGGKIWFDSEYGVGSTFYFTIPYKPVDIEQSLTSDSETKDYNWTGKTILIAEDDEPNFIFLQQVLLPTGANIVRAVNGKEAIDICAKQQVDIILMDLKMPVKNGVEATIELRRLGYKTPIIAQTAYAFSEDQQKAIRSGCNYYLSKPIQQSDLFRTISKLIGK